MNIEYRSATREEWPAFGTAVSRGFGGHPPTDEQSRERWARFFDAADNVGAWDGDQVVGTSGSFKADTTVPGGAKLPAALVTIVTVAATHRRQGILTNMMRELLKGAHNRGEPIATLWASESVIYGRFGYGMAGQQYEVKISSGAADFIHLPEISGSVRYADRKRVREVGPEIWQHAAADRPGMPDRSDDKWQWDHPLPEDESKPEKRSFYAVYEEDGRADGYVSYKTERKPGGGDQNDLRVQDLIATTDAAHAALWRFILNIDLIDEVTYETMPVDDPLWWMLADPRQLKRTPYDAIWLRILDVERALSARTYSDEVDLVIGVEDEFCPWIAGNYRLKSGAAGKAECSRTDDAADISVPAATLATCYFGNAKFADLFRAGRATEHTPGALLLADRAFAAEKQPWCPLHY